MTTHILKLFISKQIFVPFVLVVKLIDFTSANTELPKICPKIVTRNQWGARRAVAVDYSIIPVQNVIIHHTVTPTCSSEETCSKIIKSIQNFHMDKMEFHDIGYNFLIGGDGKVYEGVGWHKVGAHTRGYNTRSIGIAFIGDFTKERPEDVQLKAAKDLLQCGVELRELDKNYKLFGAKQVSATVSPGPYLFKEIQSWSNFAKSP